MALAFRFDCVRGYRHYFSQELKCLYHPRRTYREFFVQMYNYGLGRTRSAFAQGRVSVSDWLPVIVAVGTVLSLIGMMFWVWFGLLAASYIGTVGIYSGWLAISQRRPWLWPYVWIAILIIHFGMAAGQLGGLWERLRQQ